jgi:anti-anti-sigma regulatory factor
MHQGRRHVLIDLAREYCMDSAGLGQLVQSYVTSAALAGFSSASV